MNFYFSKNGTVLTAPMNPAEVKLGNGNTVKTADILTIGKVPLKSQRDLREISFQAYSDSDYFVSVLNQWKDEGEPIRLTFGTLLGDTLDRDTPSQYLIEKLDLSTAVGFEDWINYDIKLIEYREATPTRLTPDQADQARNAFIKERANTGRAATTESSGGVYHTVVPGDCLWYIAKQYYGDAERWPEIYQANRDQISNPDLIYPNQVFYIP